jgi:competence protein ComEC
VSTGQWRIFNATGITHLVAISGMHVTFFAMLCMAAARWGWRRCNALALRCRRETFAAITGVVLAFAYALLSGFSVPAQRTAVMLAAFLLARACGRVTRPMWSVAVSLVAVLLYDPLAALSAGFWLSFSAVASIVLVAGARLQPAGSLRGAVHVQWVVTAALLPVTVILFGTFSAIGPVVNAAAIPLFTFALVPPVLVATVFYLLPGAISQFIADHLVDLAAWAASTAWPMLTACADLPGALWAAQPNALWLCLAVPAAALLLLPVPVMARGASALLLLAGFFVPAPRPQTGELWLDLFDVGASRALLLRTARHQLLAGAGESFGSSGRRFETRILPTLLRAGGSGLDLWLVQKPDRDTLQAVTMGHARLAVHETLLIEGQKAPPELLPCGARDWEWDGVRFTMGPAPEGCWLRVQAGSRSLLLIPERVAGRQPAVAADAWILPRRAVDAQSLLAAQSPPHLMLAAVGASEWQSAAWATLRQEQQQRGASIFSTVQGTIRMRMGPATVPAVQQGGRWRWGIWSTSRTCAEAP